MTAYMFSTEVTDTATDLPGLILESNPKGQEDGSIMCLRYVDHYEHLYSLTMEPC